MLAAVPVVWHGGTDVTLGGEPRLSEPSNRPLIAADLRGALAHLGRGELAPAEAICLRLLTANPHRADALHMLGSVRAQQRDLPAALEHFQQALAIDASPASYWLSHGTLLKELGRHAEALTSLDNAIARDPDHAIAHCVRGDVLSALARHGGEVPGRGDEVFARTAAEPAVAARPPRPAPQVPVSWGELADKISILEIKRARLASPHQRANVERELAVLAPALDALDSAPGDLPALRADLKAINERLWQIEDDIRAKEAAAAFDAEFIRLARAVYMTNDERGRIKRRINELLGSPLVEEKQYHAYPFAPVKLDR